MDKLKPGEWRTMYEDAVHVIARLTERAAKAEAERDAPREDAEQA